MSGELLEAKVLPNGNLRVWLTYEGYQRVRAMRTAYGTDEILRTLIEGEGELKWVMPEDIGALTASPIIGNVWNDEDVWWSPNYAVVDEVQYMLDNGHFDFTRAD